MNPVLAGSRFRAAHFWKLPGPSQTRLGLLTARQSRAAFEPEARKQAGLLAVSTRWRHFCRCSYTKSPTILGFTLGPLFWKLPSE